MGSNRPQSFNIIFRMVSNRRQVYAIAMVWSSQLISISNWNAVGFSRWICNVYMFNIQMIFSFVQLNDIRILLLVNNILVWILKRMESIGVSMLLHVRIDICADFLPNQITKNAGDVGKNFSFAIFLNALHSKHSIAVLFAEHWSDGII